MSAGVKQDGNFRSLLCDCQIRFPTNLRAGIAGGSHNRDRSYFVVPVLKQNPSRSILRTPAGTQLGAHLEMGSAVADSCCGDVAATPPPIIIVGTFLKPASYNAPLSDGNKMNGK